MKYVIYRDRKKEYRWRAVARNGRIIADSAEGYKTRRACNRGMTALNKCMAITVIDTTL